ncbi:MAG: Gfo/Idh/MocA family oxidoreductase [Candidatus Binatia bacterium]|nr:Gfo/Idh/MocA family oxidoreductase [Candidatus Binatia bacterium]
MRVGIVGAGYWGKNLLRLFRERSDTEVCGIADLDRQAAEALAEGAPVASDLQELIRAHHPDAVAIATPPSTHYELARIALSHGKHCWVEKPLSLRADEAAELVELASNKRCQLFVDETFLYDPLVQTAREWIRGGRLGRVYHLSFERLGQGRIRRDSDVWWNSAPHDLSILCYWLDAAVEDVRVESFRYLQPNLADVAVGTLRLEGGISAHVYLSWMAPQKIATATVVGSSGMLVFEGRFGKRKLEFYEFRISDGQKVQGNVIPIERFACVESIAGGTEEPLALAVEAFVSSVRTGELAPSAGVFSQRVVQILERGLPYGT